METLTYKMDKQKIRLLKQRAIKRQLRVYIPSFVILSTLFYLDRGKENFEYFLLSCMAIIIFIIVLLFIGASKFKNSINSYEVILDKDGVIMKEDMTQRKKIKWENLIIEVKRNGIINLFDNNFPRNRSKIKGKGWIQIQPEIEKRHELLKKLKKYSGQHGI